MKFLLELKLSEEELAEMMKDPDNKCLEYGKCTDSECPGYASQIICGGYHSLKSDAEKREFYKKHNLVWVDS